MAGASSDTLPRGTHVRLIVVRKVLVSRLVSSRESLDECDVDRWMLSSDWLLLIWVVFEGIFRARWVYNMKWVLIADNIRSNTRSEGRASVV